MGPNSKNMDACVMEKRFQHDNDPKHTAGVIKRYLAKSWHEHHGASVNVHGDEEENSRKPAATVGGVAGHLEKHSITTPKLYRMLF